MGKKNRSSESIAVEITECRRKLDEMSQLKKHLKLLEKEKSQREREELQEYALKRIADEKLPKNLIATLLDIGSQLRGKNISELDTAALGQTVKSAYRARNNANTQTPGNEAKSAAPTTQAAVSAPEPTAAPAHQTAPVNRVESDRKDV